MNKKLSLRNSMRNLKMIVRVTEFKPHINIFYIGMKKKAVLSVDGTEIKS